TFVITFQGALRTVKNGLGVGFLSADTTLLAGTIAVATRMDGINYYGIETLNIDQGAGSDVLNVQSTSAVTNLNTGAGNDRIYVSSDANLDWTTNVGFDFLTGNLDGIRGTLNLDAGTGRQLLMISDESAILGDPNVWITDQPVGGLGLPATEITITGLAPAPITYKTDTAAGNFADGIRVWTGSGNDTITVDGTHNRAGLRTITTLNTGEGNDRVTASLDAATDGFFVVNAQGGDDTVNAAGATVSVP